MPDKESIEEQKENSAQKVNPKHQFSKKLASRTEWFWFLYLTLMVALLAYQPEIGVVAVYLSIIPTVVMGISILAYTRNSISEKIILAMLDKTKLELSAKSFASTVSTLAKEAATKKDESSDESAEEPTEETEESGGNG